MNRRNRTLLVLVVALVCAGGASFLLYRAVSSIPVRQVEVATMHVVVAKENLPMGTRLSADQVRLVGWPAAAPVPGSFSKVEDVIGRGLIEAVSANEPLTSTNLAPVEAGAGLPPSIPPGMRAMSVKVNEVIGVAGFTVPGTRVDVLVTLNRQQQGDSISRAVVSNVQVLTAGTRYDQEQAKDGTPIPSTVVTLMVMPEDAERIALAQSTGSITLVLRNPLDQDRTDTKGVRLASLMGAPEAPPVVKTVKGQPKVVTPKPVVVAADQPRLYTVEAIRGAQRKEEVVR